MDNPPPDDAHDPTSEVGSVRAESRTEDLWRLMFEQQTRNMKQLIEAIKGPSISSAICMPEYNPDTPDSDARAWSNTVDLILSEQPLQGAPLIIALTHLLNLGPNQRMSSATDVDSLDTSHQAVRTQLDQAMAQLDLPGPEGLAREVDLQ
ncbi:hypothetical protein JYU34_009163 [Plutella xylostella]|uniref:Uncharacterized protein n=1 Tax=Plutella xylostella TaxID=51655 RepID=A0ABQ7QNA8_PLUXY|nr:hypothetical protein JYU34_009163 [Plutella xylostella]